MTTPGPSPSPADLDGLDAILVNPKRLAAIAVLSHSKTTDFGFLQEHLGVSASDLSKQMSALEDVKYIEIHKSGRGRGATTSYRITSVGRAAYEQHRSALRTILR